MVAKSIELNKDSVRIVKLVDTNGAQVIMALLFFVSFQQKCLDINLD